MALKTEIIIYKTNNDIQEVIRWCYINWSAHLSNYWFYLNPNPYDNHNSNNGSFILYVDEDIIDTTEFKLRWL